jgi:hypothetical protein
MLAWTASMVMIDGKGAVRATHAVSTLSFQNGIALLNSQTVTLHRTALAVATFSAG